MTTTQQHAGPSITAVPAPTADAGQVQNHAPAQQDGVAVPATTPAAPVSTAPATRELDAAQMSTWARLRGVQAQIKTLAEEEAQLKAALREHLGVGTFTIGGQTMFAIAQGVRFDPALAEAQLTDAERAACTKTVLDREAVQKMVSPARYAAMQGASGTPSVKAAR